MLNIPKNRILLYVLLAGLLPVIFVMFIVMSKSSNVSEMRAFVEDLQQTAMIREKKEAINMAVRNHYRDTDHFYIDKYIETLAFLEPEIESLNKYINNKNFAGDEPAKKRLEYLTSGNSMVFSEGVVQSSPIFQETTETLVHPVEVNAADLQKILSRIEGIDIATFTPGPARPQLIILDFKLDRKNISDKNEVFVLNLKLLKREFL